jgi:SPP1 gp7 family putative phage head morphogenesis protein
MASAVSQLQTVIQQQRARLLSGDARLQATIAREYTAALKRLDDAVSALQAQIRAEGAATPGEVFALDRWAELRRQLTQEITRLSGLTGQTVSQAQAAAAQLGLADAQAQISGALALTKGPSAAATFARLPTGAVEDLVGSMQPGSPLHALFASIATDAPGIAEEAMTTGLTLGQGPQVVADAMAKAINMSATRAMLSARTEMLRAYRSSSLRTYAANQDILDGWTWLCDFGPRTCASCLALAGRVFPLSVQFFPGHPACRCSAAPSLKGLPPLVSPNAGAAYFDGLKPAQQDAILGKSGGIAYRNGDVALSDFIAVRESDVWGKSYSQGSLSSALQNASGGRKAA